MVFPHDLLRNAHLARQLVGKPGNEKALRLLLQKQLGVFLDSQLSRKRGGNREIKFPVGANHARFQFHEANIEQYSYRFNPKWLETSSATCVKSLESRCVRGAFTVSNGTRSRVWSVPE